MYPPIPLLIRESINEYKLPNTDIILDEGTKIIIPVMSLHHDPELFPNPDMFNPERFSEENKQNIVPCSYIPFSEAPRNCIGK